MIDVHAMINHEIKREVLQARGEFAKEIMNIIGMPKTPSEYIDKVRTAQERLSKVREEYLKFQSGIQF